VEGGATADVSHFRFWCLLRPALRGLLATTASLFSDELPSVAQGAEPLYSSVLRDDNAFESSHEQWLADSDIHRHVP
jgi:hypothetical protein